MLRAMGSQRSGYETSNIEACRDLSGRRLRHVHDEKKIADWMAGAKEREEQAKQKKQQKRDRILNTVVKHTYDHHSARVELNEAAESVADGVRAGFDEALTQRKRLLDGPAPVNPLRS